MNQGGAAESAGDCCNSIMGMLDGGEGRGGE